MELALSFALHGWPATLKFCSLGHGVTPSASDLAASGGQRQFHINNVNVAPLSQTTTGRVI
jgi:hypothetical protein